MQAIVYAEQTAKEEIIRKGIAGFKIDFVDSLEQLLKSNGEVFFILTEDFKVSDLLQLPERPIFINSVVHTLKVLQLPRHICRINGWPTFINRDSWEIAGNEKIVMSVFNNLGFRYSLVTDSPGFVAARIVAMIINEAYFAIGDGVSSIAEINIAMKLGTNYPFGPFEWASKIGINRILMLLEELQNCDQRYKPAPALKRAINF